MAWNFVFFGLSVVCLIGSAVSSLLASYTTPVVVSLCVASLVSITGVLGTLARIYLDFTLLHLKENMVTKKASHNTAAAGGDTCGVLQGKQQQGGVPATAETHDDEQPSHPRGNQVVPDAAAYAAL